MVRPGEPFGMEQEIPLRRSEHPERRDHAHPERIRRVLSRLPGGFFGVNKPFSVLSNKIEQMFDFPVDKHLFECYIVLVTEQAFDGTEV